MGTINGYMNNRLYRFKFAATVLFSVPFLSLFTALAQSNSLSISLMDGDKKVGPAFIDFEEARKIMLKMGINADQKFQYYCRAQIERSKRFKNPIKFEKQLGWFLYFAIDRKELVRIDMIGDCKSLFRSLRDCEANEIRAELAKRNQTYKGFPGWYGKYHNHFYATTNDKPIPYTNYLLGQDLTLLHRSDIHDFLLLGPMIEKPDKVELKFTNGQSAVIFDDPDKSL